MILFPKALTCPDVVRMLPKFVVDSLDAETKGRIQGHLLACEVCLVAFGDIIDEAIEEGRIPSIPVPPMPIPEILRKSITEAGCFE